MIVLGIHLVVISTQSFIYLFIIKAWQRSDGTTLTVIPADLFNLPFECAVFQIIDRTWVITFIGNLFTDSVELCLNFLIDYEIPASFTTEEALISCKSNTVIHKLIQIENLRMITINPSNRNLDQFRSAINHIKTNLVDVFSKECIQILLSHSVILSCHNFLDLLFPHNVYGDKYHHSFPGNWDFFWPWRLPHTIQTNFNIFSIPSN